MQCNHDDASDLSVPWFSCFGHCHPLVKGSPIVSRAFRFFHTSSCQALTTNQSSFHGGWNLCHSQTRWGASTTRPFRDVQHIFCDAQTCTRCQWQEHLSNGGIKYEGSNNDTLLGLVWADRFCFVVSQHVQNTKMLHLNALGFASGP